MTGHETPRRRGPKRGDRTANPAWAQMLERVHTHLRKHPNLATAAPDVQRWADQRIRELRGTTGIDSAELGALTGAGITRDTPTTSESIREQDRQSFLAELDWWISKNGDARVPQMARSRRNYWLGKQVSRARIEYARNKLDPQTIAELEKRPGWTWRVKEDRWADLWETNCSRLEEATADGKTVQDLRVTDNSLYQWVLRQRKVVHDLPTAARRRLQRIPGALPTPDQRVPIFVRAAKRWLKKHPDQDLTAVLHRETTKLPSGEDYPLGRRITYFRRRYHGLEQKAPALSPEEIALIEELKGWTWELNESYRRHRGSTS